MLSYLSLGWPRNHTMKSRKPSNSLNTPIFSISSGLRLTLKVRTTVKTRSREFLSFKGRGSLFSPFPSFTCFFLLVSWQSRLLQSNYISGLKVAIVNAFWWYDSIVLRSYFRPRRGVEAFWGLIYIFVISSHSCKSRILLHHQPVGYLTLT